MVREIAESLISGNGSPAVVQAYRDALESHDAPIVVADVDGVIRYLNKSACDIALFDSAEDLIGKPLDEAGFAWCGDVQTLFDRLDQGESTVYCVINGNSYACESTYLYDRLNRKSGILEWVRTEGDWVYDAGIDSLTGMSGKRRFFSVTRRLLDSNPGGRYVVVYWGVIRFKLINDVFSTATGNRVLANIADIIRSFVGDEGTCGRLDDDCFAFCVPRDRLSVEWFERNSEVTLMSDTAMYTFNSTYGVYEIDDPSCPVKDMCERAALAQSAASSQHAPGAESFVFFDDAMQARMLEMQELVVQLSYALASSQIKVYFQPIYDISTGRIASAEALARWEHPEKGLVLPGRFIHLFESNGMITELDKHLWDQVGAFLERRLAAGDRVVPVSVNVSRVDFFATTLVDDLDEIVTVHNLPRELLRVEITESAYADDPARIQDVIGKLRRRGYTVLLDDFGSGYSALSTVKDIPIDILKLDMSFLRDFDTDERAKYIINHVVALAHDLGYKVVAEGVETQEQVEFLRNVDCHLAQGFFYARPQPEADFVKMLDGQEPRCVELDAMQGPISQDDVRACSDGRS